MRHADTSYLHHSFSPRHIPNWDCDPPLHAKKVSKCCLYRFAWFHYSALHYPDSTAPWIWRSMNGNYLFACLISIQSHLHEQCGIMEFMIFVSSHFRNQVYIYIAFIYSSDLELFSRGCVLFSPPFITFSRFHTMHNMLLSWDISENIHCSIWFFLIFFCQPWNSNFNSKMQQFNLKTHYISGSFCLQP